MREMPTGLAEKIIPLKDKLFMSEETQEKKLTKKEQLFANYYLGEAKFNGAAAARMAGYSEKTAKEIAYQNLSKLHIVAYMRERMEALEVNDFKTLDALKDVAYSDWRDHVTIIYDSDGNEKECILMLRDKVKALEILAKIQGLMVDRHEIKLNVSELTDEELLAITNSKG